MYGKHILIFFYFIFKSIAKNVALNVEGNYPIAMCFIGLIEIEM